MQKIPLTNRSAQSDPAVHIAFRRIALQKAVQRKYPRPAYAVLFDLPNPIHSLPRANRQIQKTKPLDCLVLSLYESRDFEIIGIHFALSIDEFKQIKETDQSNHAILSCTDKIYIATDLSLEIFDEVPVYQAGESHQSKAISQPGIMQLQHCGLRILKPSNTFKANTMSRAISSLLIRKAMESGREDALNDSLMKSQKEIHKFKCEAELSLVQGELLGSTTPELRTAKN